MPEEQAATDQTTSAETAKNTGSEAAKKEEPSGTQAGTAEEKLPKTFTQAEVDRLIGRAKKDQKESFEKQIKQAEQSETERLKAEKAELETKLRSRDAEDSILAAATKAGAANPKAVVRLAHSIGIEFDDKGKVSNLKDLIDEAKEIAPEFFPKRPGKADGAEGTANGSASVGQSMNYWIRQAAGRK